MTTHEEGAVGGLAASAATPPIDDLLQLTLELAGSLDARTVMSRILERGLALAAADRATLSSMDAERLVIEATVGTGGEVTWVGRAYETDFLLRQPLVVQMLESRQLVLGGGFSAANAEADLQPALQRVRHTALIPILDRDRVAGMLVLSRYSDRPFQPGDTAELTAFGAVAGLALRNARLYEEATATARRLQAAADAATDVAAVQDLDALLHRVIEHACEAAGADSGSVMRVDSGIGIIEATSGAAPVGSRWPLDGAVTSAIAAGRVTQVPATSSSLDSEQAPLSAQYSHALVAPLRFSGEQLGILVLARRSGGAPFAASDINGLTHFATLAALVLHNGRLVHQLREAERMKREFINMAVHELRGPLTVIDGYAELLLRDTVAEVESENVRQLSTIRRQAEHARTLTDDLLTLARLESDELGVANEWFAVRDVVRPAIERALPLARLRSGSIEMDDRGAVRALGDTALTARVVDNLLANAIAYSDRPPQIVVTIAGDRGRALVRVADNGPGVAEDDRERIFARFARGSRSSGIRGTGLGLYLSRECARRMNGDVVLEETADTGSRFLLTLPAGVASAAP